MRRRRSRFAAFLPFVAALWLSADLSGVAAQAPQPPAPLDLQERLPFDPAVRTASLSNGLTYFIRHNERPVRRVSLRLAVRAGSLAERDDQQGLAHFIEHMAFNGSAHFKSGEVFSYFESVGARLGPHVNAYTSFAETVYRLDLPTDKPEVIEKGLLALADFAGGLTLDPVEVDKERGVVIEEWRGGLGAGSRVRDQQIPFLYYQSRYADRLPIGRPDVIRNAPVERLRAFYETWYRPERMALIAVGDIDPAQMESAIKTAFGGLLAKVPAAPELDTAVPIHEQLLARVVTDSEVTRSVVQIVRKRPAESEERLADYRRALVQNLVERMLNDRFAELARRPDAPFLGAGGSDQSLGPAVVSFTLGASVPDGGLEDGVRLLTAEAKRIREHGFAQSELDRAKRWMTAFYERAFNERGTAESGSFAQECLNYFLTDEPMPGIAYEYRVAKELISGIGLSDASGSAAKLLADNGRVLLAMSPQKPGIRIPTEGQLTAAMTATEALPVLAWNDTTPTRELMERKPASGRVASRREIAALGVTVVRFDNGVEAWLKPTDFRNDQVLFTMNARGGSSLAPPGDFANASLASTYVDMLGVSGLRAHELQRLLAGRLASVSPFISLSTHGFSGSAAPADLEVALQLLYQKFTAPGDDPDVFPLLKRQLLAANANRERSPQRVFGERAEFVNSSGHYTAQPLTLERIATLAPEKMLAFYRERFSNASDFALFMVGAFKVEDVVPLLAQYVGSLPASGAQPSQFKDVEMRFPAGVQRVRVERGQEPRSQAVMSFFADPPPDPVEQERITAATMVLESVLRDVLREELGQTYSVSVGLSEPLPQRGAGHIEVSFAASPDVIDAMTERVEWEIKRLQMLGPAPGAVDHAKQAARVDYETALKQNGYWMRRLSSLYLFGADPEEILHRGDRIDQLTPSMLQDVFNRYFPLDRATVVTLVPAASR